MLSFNVVDLTVFIQRERRQGIFSIFFKRRSLINDNEGVDK